MKEYAVKINMINMIDKIKRRSYQLDILYDDLLARLLEQWPCALFTEGCRTKNGSQNAKDSWDHKVTYQNLQIGV